MRENSNYQYIRSKEKDITIDTTDIKWVIREYYKQLCTRKWQFRGIEQILENHILPKLTQDKIDNLNIWQLLK